LRPTRAHRDAGLALRLGLRQIAGFRAEWAEAIAAARRAGAFTGLEDLARRAALPPRALRLLADADACASLGLDRRRALWEARRTPCGELPLFAAARLRDGIASEMGAEPETALPAATPGEEVAADYQMMRLRCGRIRWLCCGPILRSIRCCPARRCTTPPPGAACAWRAWC
jgi:error-prone DNA polymerase